MLKNKLTHELSDDLRGWAILLAAGGEELLAKLTLDAYAETRIFHFESVADGYTSCEMPFGISRIVARQWLFQNALQPCDAGGETLGENFQRIARAPATARVADENAPLDQIRDVAQRGVLRGFGKRGPLGRC